MAKNKTKDGVVLFETSRIDAMLRYVANFRPEEVMLAGDMTESEFNKLIGPAHWTVGERRRMEDVLHRIV